METLRVGVVGFGLAGRVFHAPFVTAVPGLELAAVVERRSRNAQAQYPEITTHTSLESLLADPTIDLVVVGTPSGSHFEVARQVIEAGKHVVVDKPVASSSAEIAALGALAQAQGRHLIPFHNRRWDSDFRTLQQALHEEKLGKVVSFESTFDRWRPAANPEDWRQSGDPGSGLHLDLGTHLVDQILHLFGLPLGVSGEVLAEREGAEAIDSFTIRLRYPGFYCTASANLLSAEPRPHYRVRGTRGHWLKWGLDPQEDALRHLPVVSEPWGLEPASAWASLTVEDSGSTITRPVPSIPGDYRLFYAGVRDCLLGISPAPVTPLEAWQTMRVIELAQESTAEHREIACDWTKAPF